MKFTVNKILSAGIVIAILATGLVLFISLRQSQRIRDTVASVSHTEQVLARIQNLVMAVIDNETGSRGYVLTGKEEFLEPLKKSEKDIINEQAQLKKLVRGDNIQETLFDSLVANISKRIAFSEETAVVRKERGLEEASTLVLTGRGKHYSDRIRSLGSMMQQQENELLETRKRDNERTISRLNILLYCVLALNFALTILIIQRIGASIKKQNLNEQKFSALLDAAPDATVIVNEKGTIVMVNQQVENLFGYKRSEMVGQKVEILIPADLRGRHVHHRDGFVKEARVRSMGAGIELKAVKKDGVSFPVEISLSPIRTKEGMLVSASVRDITDRKKSEEKFRSLLDSAPDATVIVNEEGIIQMVNHQTENLFGYVREEMIGKPVEILIPAELRSKHGRHRGNFVKAAKVRAMGEGIELNAVKKNGMRFPVEISLSPINTEEGMLISAAVRDITLRKSLEGELRKSNAEMEAFTYSVSHDLRAPLRGIIGFTAILEEDYASKLDDEAKRITSVIRHNTLKMGHLIDALLDFSRMGKQELIKTQINSRSMVHEIIAELGGNNQHSAVTWNIHELAPVKADMNTIRQVWINLISNAIKYSGNKTNPVIEIGSYFQEGQTVFYVKDNGVGFDEQYKHKLFKVFQRLHGTDEFEGTGVGLALIEKIVSSHGGKVWAEGKENEGACFYFSLPL